jgi:hypothetical protein
MPMCCSQAEPNCCIGFIRLHNACQQISRRAHIAPIQRREASGR